MMNTGKVRVTFKTGEVLRGDEARAYLAKSVLRQDAKDKREAGGPEASSAKLQRKATRQSTSSGWMT